jgi:ABC-type branched-subunit amino acid transport system ATPase component
MVFEILASLQREHDKAIVMVEQNAKKGLELQLLANPRRAGCFLSG